MARPSIITDEFIKHFCSKLRISGSIPTAILGTGIGRETYYRWARQVREGRGKPMVKRFIKAVEIAEVEMKQTREHMLSQHFDKNWRLPARCLVKNYPEEYARRRVCGDVEDPQRHGTAARGRRGNMGRDTVITEDLIKRFCYVITISGSITTALMNAGIGWEVYDEWADQVREGHATPAVKQFMRAVEEAEVAMKLRCEFKLAKHFDKHWRAPAWWLERKYSGEYARQAPPPRKQDAEGRFGRAIRRKGKYADELDEQRNVVLRVRTAEEMKQGVRPGLVEISPEDIATRPWEVCPSFWRPSSLGPLDQSQAVPGSENSPDEEANHDADSGRDDEAAEPEVDLLAGLETAERTGGEEVLAPENPQER